MENNDNIIKESSSESNNKNKTNKISKTKTNKTSKTKTNKTSKTNTNKTLYNKSHKRLIQTIEKQSNILQGSYLRKFTKAFLEENKKNKLFSKLPIVELITSVFSQTGPKNLIIVSSITNNPLLFFKNCKKSAGKYIKDVHPIDLYISSIICGLAYNNDTLIGLMVIMIGDKNIDGNVIRNIVNTLLSGYIPSNADAQIGGIPWKNVIMILIFIANLIFILLESSHFYSSTKNLTKEFQEGRTLALLENLKEVSNNSNLFRSCLNYAEIHPATSNTQQLFQSGFKVFGENTYNILMNVNNYWSCIENPEIHIRLGQELLVAQTGLQTANDEKIIDIDESILETEPVNEIQVQQFQSSITLSKYSVALVDHISDMQLSEYLNDEQLLKVNDGIEKIQKKFEEKLKEGNTMTYKDAFHYLDDLADPTDDKLAKTILNDEDFKLYYQDKVEKMDKLKDMYAIHVKDSTLIGKIGLITGAIKELIWTNPSHAPFLDIVNTIRTKINTYVRMMRDKYNLYTDWSNDVLNELSIMKEKIEVADNRLRNILLLSIPMMLQILGISYYGLRRIIRFSNKNTITNSRPLELTNE